MASLNNYPRRALCGPAARSIDLAAAGRRANPRRKVKHRLSSVNRRGSLIIEAVVSSALLATAVVAVTHLGVASKKLGSQADAQMLATLEAANILERLQGSELNSLNAQAASIQASYPSDSATITATPFSNGPNDGVHLFVELRVNERAVASVNDWRLVATKPVQEPDETESSGDVDTESPDEPDEPGDSSEPVGSDDSEKTGDTE